MTGFSLTAPARTVFGRDSRINAAAEIASFGKRVLLVRGRAVPWVDTLVEELTRSGCHLEIVFSTGEPDLEDIRKAVTVAKDHKADCIVSVGGGAVIDLGKAVAGVCQSAGDVADYLELGYTPALRLNDPLPFIAIPTTAGTGAEATRNAVIGVPERQAKISLRDPRLVPDLALVDPALTDGAPKALTLASGLDAITQLIESYLCNRANPVTDAWCKSSILPAVSALYRLMHEDDAQARDDMARASYLSGLALANSGLGIVHGLASVIGGRGAAHGAVCGRLLAAGLSVNRDAVKRKSGDVARFRQIDDWLANGFEAPDGDGTLALQRFVTDNGLPSLRELGVPKAEIETIARLGAGASSTKANPVVLDHVEICRLLERA